jgi:hypothetical protein
MSQFATQTHQSSSSRGNEVSESAFEFLLAEILSQPAYMTDSADDTNETNLHRLDTLGYDVGYR